MNVTPTDAQYSAISSMCDAFVGEQPLAVEVSRAANARREMRNVFMDLMHKMVAMSMREGARRAFEERGIPTAPAPMKGQNG